MSIDPQMINKFRCRADKSGLFIESACAVVRPLGNHSSGEHFSFAEEIVGCPYEFSAYSPSLVVGMCCYKSDVACPVFPHAGGRHSYDRRARSANINNGRQSSIQGVDHPEAIQGFEMGQKPGIFPEAGIMSRKYCE